MKKLLIILSSLVMGTTNIISPLLNHYSYHSVINKEYRNYDINLSNYSVPKMLELNHQFYQDNIYLKNKNNDHNILTDEIIYVMNPNYQTKHPFDVTLTMGTESVTLVLESYRLYIQGFLDKNNIYHYFTKADYKTYPGAKDNLSLNYNGDYRSLTAGLSEVKLTYNGFNKMITNLQTPAQFSELVVRESLINAILLTAEAFRFANVLYDLDAIINQHQTLNWFTIKDDYLMNWSQWSKDYIAGNKNNALNYLNVLTKES
ncbi:ribosome-inactivating family protein [Spiroplasma eriocheiris]|uniref:Uncharacterized protein n=1 Tax=Spiroplasma eriocheiris TaxID=315358 RepID=A0A0H3XJH5_9MOLU|nr:ribosome-inactivating family protein [Spiroplasma eriocheiris]AHF57545.1 hypothetical protein SPE_0416 [Spiroplasma eriocheiris CCTCC M 207170]AKM54001.1 hypothetical protein SERIO_v1c04220 [Spiroplasma eriocheiris]